MKLFLDTANLDDIKKYAAWGVVDGVTTNPSLVAKEGVKLEKRIKEIAKVVNGPISAEVIATDAKGMLKEARQYAKWHKNIHVKVPCTPDGLMAVKQLSKENIKTNVTLVFSPSQALLAAKAGATLISPFIGRVDDMSYNGMQQVIGEIMNIWAHYQFESEILVASIRSIDHVEQAAEYGAHIATIPPAIFDKLIHHPLTDMGIERFLNDWKKVAGKQK